MFDRKFLRAVCDVPEPGERFDMDEYSELVIVNRPVIYISISELLNTHKVCVSLLSLVDLCGPDPHYRLQITDQLQTHL